MALTNGCNLGTKHGPYEIRAPLGAGGMREMYRAQDTRLDREAIVLCSRISPSTGSNDEEIDTIRVPDVNVGVLPEEPDWRIVPWFVVGFLLFLSLSIALYAQSGSGLISGTVTDPSRAIVAKASVLALEIHTSSARSTITNEHGFYSFSELQPGDYDLSVEAPGFALFVVRAHVSVGSRISIDPVLSLSPVQNITTVVGEGGVQVETQTQMLSEVVNGLQITELPTLTRNPYDLVALAGNISPGDPAGRGVGAAINGQRAASTNINLDGAENTNSYFSTIAQAVPLDSVREFRLSQSTFTAEYGRASGGMVDVETRSGTNNFHGSVYEFNRVSYLAANTFDNNARNLPRGIFTRNQFGYAIGGPIVKDRLFFFQSTEWTRVRSQQTLLALVPTPEFIAASAPATAAYFNMFAGPADPINGTVYTKADLRAAGIITNPGGPFDALPPDTPILGTANYRTSSDAGGGDPQNSYSLLARLDFNASENTKLFGRFALENAFLLPGVAFSSPYPGYEESFSVLNKNALLGLTHVFSSTLVSQTKLGFNRLGQQSPLGAAPLGPSLNFPGSFNVFGIGVTLPGYGGDPGGSTQYEWQFYQDLTWTLGKHQFRAGGQFLHIRNSVIGVGGIIGYEQLGIESADSLDNFLLGQIHHFAVAVNPQGKFPCLQTPDGQPVQTPACTLTLPLQSPSQVRTTLNRDGAAYVQDTFRIYKRLTLNLGLRWEYYGVQYTENQNLASNFYLGPGSNFAEQIRNGQVLTVPESPIHNLWRPDYNNFGPRIGFAWDLLGDGTTSLRAGYGISFERNFGSVFQYLPLNPPSYAYTSIVAGTPLYPTIDISTENLGPFAANSGTLVYPDSIAIQVDANIKTAYAETWSLSIDRQLLPNTVLSLAYSGSHGVHLYSNTLTDMAGSGVVYGRDDPNVNPLGTLNRQYGKVYTFSNGAFSIYNALLVRVQGQNVKNTGLNFTANYTFSHTIDNSSSTFPDFQNDYHRGFLDFLNPALDRGDAEFDIRHRFVAGAIWQSPFFAAPTSPWRHLILGGWTLSSIFTASTGNPFSIWDCTLANTVCPRYIPSSHVSTAGHAVDTGQPNFFEYIPLPPAVPYANPLIGISDFGNCSLVPAPPCPFPANMTRRDLFRGPGIWSLDLGIYKNFQLHEGWVLQFRGELFNAFNHPNLYANTGQAEITANPEFISASKSGSRNVQLALKLTF